MIGRGRPLFSADGQAPSDAGPARGGGPARRPSSESPSLRVKTAEPTGAAPRGLGWPAGTSARLDRAQDQRRNERVLKALETNDLRAVAALSDADLAAATLTQRARILARSTAASLSLWRKLGIGKHAGLDISRLIHRVLATVRSSDELDALMNEAGARGLREHLRRERDEPRLSKTLEALRETKGRGDWSQFGDYLESVCAAPSSGRNRLDLLLDTAFLPVLLEEIRAARQSVDVQLFIAEGDAVTERVFEALAAKAREGVRVRVILDEFGTRAHHRDIDEATRALGEAGVEVHLRPSPPLKDHLDHRKVWIVDGQVGFVGGMNLGESYHSAWHDQQTRVEGPAVGRLERLFEVAWSKVSDAPSSFAPGARCQKERPEGAITHVVHHGGGRADENIKFAYLRAIRTASDSIRIATPYFTDKDIVDALADAARRGVRVELMLPRENDHRFMLDAARILYGELLDAGVRIYEHTERMVHLKVAVFDGEVATVGSSNLDARSLENNDEVNLFVLDRGFARQIEKQIFEAQRPRTAHITEVPIDAPNRAYRYVLRKAMDLL